MEESTSKNAQWYLLTPTLLAGLTALFYYPSLRYGYVFDDMPRITDNFYLKKQSLSILFFSSTRWIADLLNRITYGYYQLDPFGYRIVNVGIHIASGLLIFFLFLKVLQRSAKPFLQTNASLIALATAGLFLLHPAQTQTVTYITQMRLEGIATFFTLLIITLFSFAALSKNMTKKAVLYASATLLAIPASGSKEIIIVLPLLAVLFDWFFIAQADIASIVKRGGMHLLVAVFLYTTFASYSQPISIKKTLSLSQSAQSNRGNTLTHKPNTKIMVGTFFISQFKVISHYIRIFFLPTNLTFDYDIKLSESFWQKDVIYPLLFLLSILLSGLLLFLLDPTNVFAFCTAWFFIAVLPRASIIPSPELVCDYKTYLSSVGIFFLLSVTIVGIAQALYSFIAHTLTHNFKRTVVHAFLFFLLIPLGYATQQRNCAWETKLTFWADVVAKSPKKARAYNNYAVALARAGKVSEAVKQYHNATQVDPSYAEPYINLAFHFQRSKNRKKALEYYHKGLNLVTAAHPEMYQNLGTFNFEGGDYKRAKKCFEIAIKLRPYYSRAHFYLARIHLMEKKYELAKASLEKATAGDLQAAEIYYLFGQICYQQKEWDDAIKSLSIAYNANRNYKNIAFLLGSCYYHKNSFQRAVTFFEESYKKNPKDEVVRYNYAQALLHCNEYKKALPVFKQCNSSNPSYAYAPLHVAKCLEKCGEKNSALNLLQTYIKTGPYQKVKVQAQTMYDSLNA